MPAYGLLPADGSHQLDHRSRGTKDGLNQNPPERIQWVDAPALPIFYGTIPTASLQYNSVAEQAQKDFAVNDASAYCRDNSALPLLDDDLHFDAAGCIEFGEWVVSTFESVVGA